MPPKRVGGGGRPGSLLVDPSRCLVTEGGLALGTEDEIDAICDESLEDGEATDDEEYVHIIDAADDDDCSADEVESGNDKTHKSGAKQKDFKRKGGPKDFDQLRLEDYIPDQCIESLEKRDRCSLAITMKYNARSADLTELSGDIIKLVFKGRWNEGSTTAGSRPTTRKAFARYLSPAIAVANMKLLQRAMRRGKLLRVERCVTRRTSSVGNMLDVFRLPWGCSVRRLKDHFPGARVLIIKNGFARLEFDNVDQVRRVLKKPGCTSIDGHMLRFSLVKVLPAKQGGEFPRQQRSSYGGGDNGSFTGGRRGWNNGRAFWRPRGGGNRGSRYFWNRHVAR